MFVLLVFLVMAIGVECQLNFHAEQRLQELDIQCEVKVIRNFNDTTISKLVISKSIQSSLELLASVSARNAPSYNLSNVQVTGYVSHDVTSKPYLRIRWTDLTESLNGNFTCQAYGINNELLSTEQISVQLRSEGLHLVATHSIIQVGLAKRLEISCSVPDTASLNVSKVGSLDIFKIQSGYQFLFARIRSTPGTSSQTTVVGLQVSGSIDRDKAFIVISWRNPTAYQAGEYICEVSGIGVHGHPVFFSKRVNITWEQPPEALLMKRLSEMTKRQDEVIEVEPEAEQLLQETIQTNITVKNQCRNPTSCDDIYFTLKQGQHIVRVEPLDGLGPIDVLCDSTGRREIYTVFQKRFSGQVDFYRNFKDYEDGFGSIDGEFWLGLKNIRRLLVQTGDKNQLRVDMTVMGAGINYTRIYPNFSIGPGDDFNLTVSGLYDRGFGMSSNSGKQFSTYDRGLREVSSSKSRGAGWWFPQDQGYVNLNGVWGVPGKPYSIFWWELRQDLNFILEKTEMKFRRSS